MAVRSRAGLVPPLGLFIFLDLITALSGVLVLITMFLTTFLERGSPLFPGSAAAASPKLETDLRGRLREQEKEFRQAEEIAERLRWAEYSPREIRRMLRRLQGLPGEGAAPGEKSQEQILAEMGLSALQEEVQKAETALQKREAEVQRERSTHERLDRMVRKAQAGQAEDLGKGRGIRLVKDGKDTTKRPLVLELAFSQAKFFPLDQPENFLRLDPDDRLVSRLRRELFGYPPDSHFVFLLVQPSGYGRFGEVRSALQSLGYEVGFDGVPEDPRLLLPETAAPSVPGFRSSTVLGDPEPWPVDAKRIPSQP